ncbi:MAG: RluA family pseudouridine synthase [Bacillota bacterium]
MNDRFPTTSRVLVPPESAGARLDAYLPSTLAEMDLSRSRVQSLIEEGNVLLNGSRPKASARLKAGDVIDVTVPPPRVWDMAAEDIPLDIVYEDEHILIINKPRGMVVHPAAGHWSGTLANAILSRCPDLAGIGGEIRPGIVHRLDKDTTGLLVVAKDEKSMKDLQDQIKARKVKRQYIALVRGRIGPDAGTVDAPIGRHPVHRKKMAVVDSGRPAVTDYEVIARFGQEYTLVLAKLRTGRTHQIRVHMGHLGHPVAADPVYSRGNGELGMTGQALHAWRLGLYRPGDGEYVEFSAPLPEDFRNALETLKRRHKEELPTWIK